MFGLGLRLTNLLKKYTGGTPPVAFPDFGSSLIFKDYLGFGRVFQDVEATIPVASSGTAVGCVIDFSSFSEEPLWDDGSTGLLWDDDTTALLFNLHHAVQATTTKKPLLEINSDGRFYLKHDKVDDYLGIPDIASGVYTMGTSSWSGTQIYETTQTTTGEFKFNPADTHSRVLVQGSLTAPQRADLLAWLESRRLASGATDVLRLNVATTSVNVSVTQSGDAGVTWLLGDGQTASGVSCVKTIVAPQTLIFRAVTPSRITELDWSGKYLFGQMDLSKLTGLRILYLSSNSLAGCLCLSANTALQTLYMANNFLGGHLILTTNTALVTLQASNNLLSGNINVSSNVLLQTCSLANNQFSSFSGSVSNTLGTFQVQNNLLTQVAIDAILLAFVTAGKTTGTRILALEGTGNASPSVTGLGYKATLVSRGWTVTHN
jgi:hypothetical protein